MTLYKVTVTKTVEATSGSPTWREGTAEYYVEEEIKTYGFNHCEVTVEEVTDSFKDEALSMDRNEEKD